MLQVLLGLQPYAAANMLALVRPSLPPWLPALTVRGLRVGDAVVDLAFEWRTGGSAAYEATVHEGTLRVLEVPPPNSVDDDASLRERMATWLLEHVPGRSLEAMRIAMGSDDVLQ